MLKVPEREAAVADRRRLGVWYRRLRRLQEPYYKNATFATRRIARNLAFNALVLLLLCQIRPTLNAAENGRPRRDGATLRGRNRPFGAFTCVHADFLLY